MGALSQLPPIVLGVLAGMDKQGEQILGTWLYGGGVAHDIRDDPLWSDYMMAHKGLAAQILVTLKPAVQKLVNQGKRGRFPISERFHAELTPNSGMSGYALLHGSNKDAGDFLVAGFAEIADAYDPVDGDFDIRLELSYVFNDIVDPNGNYVMDKIRSTIARIITLDSPRNYRLSIGWKANGLVEVRKGVLNFYGYPSPYLLPVRPLPAAKLDVAALNRKWALEQDAKIIAQLQRRLLPNDRVGIADRRSRLLWLFYDLDSYWWSTYRTRLATDTDELARLVKQRLSTELRKEILQTLQGKRPTTPRPPEPAARVR